MREKTAGVREAGAMQGGAPEAANGASRCWRFMQGRVHEEEKWRQYARKDSWSEGGGGDAGECA